MSARLREVVRRRRLLVARVAEQRGELALQAAAARRTLAFADLAWRGYRLVKSRPLVVALGAAALAAIGPGKLLRVGYRSGLIVMAALRLIRMFRASR